MSKNVDLGNPKNGNVFITDVSSSLSVSIETELTPLLVIGNYNKEICKVSHEYFKLDNKKKNDFLDTMANWVDNEKSKL